MTQATEYTFDDNLFSDLHKDAYGYRPSHSFFQYLNCASDDEKQALWDDLLSALEATVTREEERKKEAIARFEASVAVAIASGAKDRATAVRWLMDAQMEEFFRDDVEHFEYELGIPFGYINKTSV